MLGILRSMARSPGAPIAALGALLCLATVVLFLTDLQGRYWSRIAQAKADAQSFARVLAEHTVLTFEDVDRALLRAETIRKTTLSRTIANPGLANAALHQLQKSSPLLVAIGWTDASGEVIAHSYDKPLPRSNISSMPHFIAQRDKADGGLFISPPYKSAATDKWFTAASRRLDNPDGSFAGIVTAPLDQSYFTKIYRSIDLGHGGSVLLLHREGGILAREPERKDAVGKSFVDGPLLTKYLPAAEQGAYETTSVVDGRDRIAGYKAVPGLPLVLIVTYARAEVLAPWYQHLTTFGLLVAAIVVIILFGTIALVRQTNNIAAKTRALAGINGRFEAALGNMPHGLSMFDRHRRLVTWNARYAEIYQLPPALLRAGTHVNLVMVDLVIRGMLKGGTDQAAISAKVAAMDSIPTDANGSRVEEFSDGRLIRVTRQPMKDGGWVSTHEASRKRGAPRPCCSRTPKCSSSPMSASISPSAICRRGSACSTPTSGW
jgi:PAS domain-containing protein